MFHFAIANLHVWESVIYCRVEGRVEIRTYAEKPRLNTEFGGTEEEEMSDPGRYHATE